MAIANEKNYFIDLTIRKYVTNYYDENGISLEGKPNVELKETETKNSISIKEAIEILLQLLFKN